MSLTKTYVRLFESANTINELNRIHLAWESYLTPQQRDDLLTGLKNHFGATSTLSRLAYARVFSFFLPAVISATRPRRRALYLRRERKESDRQQRAGITNFTDAKRNSAVKWILKNYYYRSMAGDTEQARYVAKSRRASFSLFRRGEVPSESLLIAFPTKKGRLGMPLADFLQSAHGLLMDVVVVGHPKQRGMNYWTGSTSMGEGLQEILDKIASELGDYDLRRAHTLGVSAGTIPAIVAGLYWKTAGALAIGAFAPPSHRWLGPLGEALEKGAMSPDIPTKTRFVYGENAPVADAEVSHFLAQLLGGESEEIENTHHVPLFPLLARQELAAWMHSTFLYKAS
jgi:hypothetical protein